MDAPLLSLLMDRMPGKKQQQKHLHAHINYKSMSIRTLVFNFTFVHFIY